MKIDTTVVDKKTEFFAGFHNRFLSTLHAEVQFTVKQKNDTARIPRFKPSFYRYYLLLHTTRFLLLFTCIALHELLSIAIATSTRQNHRLQNPYSRKGVTNSLIKFTMEAHRPVRSRENAQISGRQILPGAIARSSEPVIEINILYTYITDFLINPTKCRQLNERLLSSL